jgi:hypothetical protein
LLKRELKILQEKEKKSEEEDNNKIGSTCFVVSFHFNFRD